MGLQLEVDIEYRNDNNSPSPSLVSHIPDEAVWRNVGHFLVMRIITDRGLYDKTVLYSNSNFSFGSV